jgi:hypothetical protein
VGDISSDEGAEKVVDYIFHGMHAESAWRWLREHVDRDQFLASLLESDRTSRALFDLVMASFAAGKPIRGEKTPSHVYHVSTLLRWFPEAKVVHTFRDPRAIFVSKRVKIATGSWDSPAYRAIRSSELRLNTYLALSVLIQWLKIVQLHHRYEARYPQNYLMIRFEDLIRHPANCIRKICGFLEVKFSDRLLQQRVVGSSFASQTGSSSGFDSSVIERWRGQIHPLVSRWFIAWCRKPMRAFGYEP